jgi:deoxyribodipyrimidine photo-lyase
MNHQRLRIIKEGPVKHGPVVLWMSRDQRVKDNWALIFAQKLAVQKKVPLLVIFCLVPQFLHATTRQYRFMLHGLREVEQNCLGKNMPFLLLTGLPETVIPEFMRTCHGSALVKDFDPLRVKRQWTDAVAREIDIPFFEVDAHNIIPCWSASPKQEFGARTFRPKVYRVLDAFLEAYPSIRRHPFSWDRESDRPIENSLHFFARNRVEHILTTLKVDPLPGTDWIKPGEKAAYQCLSGFIKKKLPDYAHARNNPAVDGQSNLSPYLHFGHISPQRVALEVRKIREGVREHDSHDAFLEELVVRRELSDNFCFYNADYDSFEGFPEWAKKTLSDHRKDKREYLYVREQFEQGETHDALWNAAQMEMVKRGKMHGYMRMYWAKKIFEWTESPEQAMETAVYLNDRYELDGRDPNGYAGIAWSIGGVHDRAWNERRVFGKIRFMSYHGCKSKFDVRQYIHDVSTL